MKLALSLLAFLAMAANAGTLAEPKGVVPQAPQYNYSNPPQYMPPLPIKIRSWRAPGMICFEIEDRVQPTIFQFKTTFEAHMRFDIVQSCWQKLQQKKWELSEPGVVEILASYRMARCQNMTYYITHTLNGMRTHTVQFSHPALTGKEAELQDCKNHAISSPDMKKPAKDVEDNPAERNRREMMEKL